MFVDLVPKLSLAHYQNLDTQKQFISELGKAYETVGFVAIKDHGINETLIQKFYQQIEEFFSLPIEEKLSYQIKGLNGQRGYTPFGTEHAKGSDQPDLKEFWQIGNPKQSELKNVVISEIAGFKENSEELFSQFQKAGTIILQAIAQFLNLETQYFDQFIDKGNSILRAIHYPPITKEPMSAVRAEAHEDINLITLLVGASADGLELLDRNNQWQKVIAPEGYIIVNVGDMLQRLTNNVLKSTTHRVVNPPKDKWHTHRYSIPFFLHPISEMSLDCLKNCITEDNQKQYPPITAGEYLHERLVEIGLA